MNLPQIQILTVVNPAVSYHKPEGQIEGMGIRIPALLSLLDEYHIAHIEESLMRTLIRNRQGCKSRATQYFLKVGMTRNVIVRDNSSTPMSCACIPYKDIPDEFIESLSQGTECLYICTYVVVITSR